MGREGGMRARAMEGGTGATGRACEKDNKVPRYSNSRACHEAT